MIIEKQGDILDEPRDTWIVIPVNTRGVAGAGLARQWKQRCPLSHEIYLEACQSGRIKAGGNRWIQCEEGQFILAATKDHWKNPSQMIWIGSIVEDLADNLKLVHDALEVAIPPIGCGLGGLLWPDVRDLLLDQLLDHEGDDRLERHTITLYVPR